MPNLKSLRSSLASTPLSVIAPSAASAQESAHIKALLRHPRSRIRITPGWRAPSLTASLRSADALIHASRHRVTSVMWHKLTGQSAPENQPLFLVTLSATVDEDSLRGTASDITVDIHSLFRSVVGNAWVQEDNQPLVWTWHCLVTQTDLEATSPEVDSSVA